MASHLPRINSRNKAQELIDFDLNQGGTIAQQIECTTLGFIVVKRKKSKSSVHRTTKRNEKTTVEKEKSPARRIQVEVGD